MNRNEESSLPGITSVPSISRHGSNGLPSAITQSLCFFASRPGRRAGQPGPRPALRPGVSTLPPGVTAGGRHTAGGKAARPSEGGETPPPVGSDPVRVHNQRKKRLS